MKIPGLPHGVHAKTYRAWTNMKTRCNNSNYKNTDRYKEDGITYEPRWESYQNFLTDLGEAPEGLQLDRKDNDGDYCKDNCRWATPSENKRNASGTKLVPELIKSIRADTRASRTIAKDYGIGKSQVLRIRQGIQWGDVA